MLPAPAAGTIIELIRSHAGARPEQPALLAPGRSTLSYGSLVSHIEATACTLRAHGVQREDRVAIVLPNGPDMATAFLAVATAAMSAPLNPAYTLAEFAFYLHDLNAKALIVLSDLDSPARAAATAAGIPVVDLTPQASAGTFSLAFSPHAHGDSGHTVAHAVGFAKGGDVALVLHTSGTTSRPKQVPLTHANLRASARHIAAALELTDRDRCLNIMPLFHIHGLIGALLSSLGAGASVVCSPGLLVPDIFDWMAAFRPSWYTAVPTMHHAISVGAGARTQPVEHAFRFIRSSSSALPRQTLSAIESVFGVPVIEAYGMTEASHQMASNPLPPRPRKPGSVGIAAGPAIAIMNEHSELLGASETGEVVIRGPNVTAGYAGNPDANAAAFSDGWFRTGDQGSLDGDGYLFLNGRLKELINRGGEKISPVEIDEVLLDHPAVAQALTFAMPHPTLGEEVAAAVVLGAPDAVSEKQMREFVAARLALFKVPRRIFVLDAIPKGPTGKPQRIGLHQKLGLATLDLPTADEPLESGPVHEILGAIWSEVLGAAPPTLRTSFFDAGGDSLLATQFVTRLGHTLAVELSLLEFFDGPTIAEVALLIGPRLDGGAASTSMATNAQTVAMGAHTLGLES